MMNYEEFKQKVQNEFKNYLGEEYKDAEVFIREVTKVNMQVDQMSLLNLPGNDFASPSISLQSIFPMRRTIVSTFVRELWIKERSALLREMRKSSPYTRCITISRSR